MKTMLNPKVLYDSMLDAKVWDLRDELEKVASEICGSYQFIV